MLVETIVFCKSCGSSVSSQSPYIVKSCGCGQTTVTKGTILGKDYLDMSWEMDDEVVKNCITAIGGATEKKEIVLAVLSALRRADRVIADSEPKIVGFRDNQVMVVKNGNYITYEELK